jgi:hypothetical protein
MRAPPALLVTIKFQGAMPGTSVVPHQNPADLDDAIAIAPDAKVNGIGPSLIRQMRTIAGIAKIAAPAQLVVGRGYVFVSRHRTAAHEAVTERQAATMRPQFGFMPQEGKEIWAGHNDSPDDWLILARIGLLKTIASGR